MRRAILAVAVALTSYTLQARGDQLSVRAAVGPGDWVLAELRTRGVLDEELIDALESGLPTRLRYKVELWRDRRRVWDELELTELLEYRVHYDVLDESYRVFDGTGATIVDGASEDTLRELLEYDEIELLGVEELERDESYYLTAELDVEPLSVEEIRDLENWLRGTVSTRSGDGGIVGISSHLIAILRNEVGLGGRKLSARSSEFDQRELENSREDPD